MAVKGKITKKNIYRAPIDNPNSTDIYHMIEINCKYRQRIHDMLKELRLVN